MLTASEAAGVSSGSAGDSLLAPPSFPNKDEMPLFFFFTALTPSILSTSVFNFAVILGALSLLLLRVGYNILTDQLLLYMCILPQQNINTLQPSLFTLMMVHPKSTAWRCFWLPFIDRPATMQRSYLTTSLCPRAT